jgi:hypothetical protein
VWHQNENFLITFERITTVIEDLAKNLLSFFEAQESKPDDESNMWIDYEVAWRKLERKFHIMVNRDIKDLEVKSIPPNTSNTNNLSESG